MKREIGQALGRELRHVRVGDGLRACILAEATRERRAARRRHPYAKFYVAAALAFLAIGVGTVLSLGRPHPDLQRTAVLAPGDGGGNGAVAGPLTTPEPTPTPSPEPTPTPSPQPTPTPTPEMPVVVDEPTENWEAEDWLDEDYLNANLFLYATAFEGGVFTVESSFQYDFSYFETTPPEPDGNWAHESISDPEEVAKEVDGVFDAAAIEEWMNTHENGEALGLWYDWVFSWLENVSTQMVNAYDGAADVIDATEYHFVQPGYSGNRLSLYLLEQPWTAKIATVDVFASQRNCVWDGETLWRSTEYARDGVRQLDDETFAVNVEDGLGDHAAPTAVKLPVENGGEAAVYQGGTGWVNADDGSDAFAMTITIVDFEDGEVAILLEPMEDHSMTARVHAVTAPEMTLDTAIHPGMAGWIFSETPDEADVIDIVDEHGVRTTITMEELEGMVGLVEPTETVMEVAVEGDGAAAVEVVADETLNAASAD